MRPIFRLPEKLRLPKQTLSPNRSPPIPLGRFNKNNGLDSSPQPHINTVSGPIVKNNCSPQPKQINSHNQGSPYKNLQINNSDIYGANAQSPRISQIQNSMRGYNIIERNNAPQNINSNIHTQMNRSILINGNSNAQKRNMNPNQMYERQNFRPRSPTPVRFVHYDKTLQFEKKLEQKRYQGGFHNNNQSQNQNKISIVERDENLIQDNTQKQLSKSVKPQNNKIAKSITNHIYISDKDSTDQRQINASLQNKRQNENVKEVSAKPSIQSSIQQENAVHQNIKDSANIEQTYEQWKQSQKLENIEIQSSAKASIKSNKSNQNIIASQEDKKQKIAEIQKISLLRIYTNEQQQSHKQLNNKKYDIQVESQDKWDKQDSQIRMVEDIQNVKSEQFDDQQAANKLKEDEYISMRLPTFQKINQSQQSVTSSKNITNNKKYLQNEDYESTNIEQTKQMNSNNTKLQTNKHKNTAQQMKMQMKQIAREQQSSNISLSSHSHKHAHYDNYKQVQSSALTKNRVQTKTSSEVGMSNSDLKLRQQALQIKRLKNKLGMMKLQENQMNSLLNKYRRESQIHKLTIAALKTKQHQH